MIHGWSDDAVQLTVPLPLCVSVRNCAGVAKAIAPLLLTTPMLIDEGVSVIVGPAAVGDTVTAAIDSTMEPDPLQIRRSSNNRERG